MKLYKSLYSFLLMSSFLPLSAMAGSTVWTVGGEQGWREISATNDDVIQLTFLVMLEQGKVPKAISLEEICM